MSAAAECECFPGGWAGTEWQDADDRFCPVHDPDSDPPTIADERNVAHAVDENNRPACGAPLPDLPDDIRALLVAPWSLQSDPQYRLPPATACERCSAAMKTKRRGDET